MTIERPEPGFGDEVAMLRRFQAIERSEQCLATALANDPDLGQLVARPRPPEKGETATLRWLLVHMVEEYARHAGHADLIRQSIDGATDV